MPMPATMPLGAPVLGLPAPRHRCKTVAEAFEWFLAEEVNLTPSERKQAADSHHYLRSVIKSRADEDATLFNLIDGDFLTGSYDRATKIRPLNDVDLFLILDGAGLSFADAPVEGNGAGSNPLLSARYATMSRTVSAGKVLDALLRALRRTYPKSRIRLDGQAVNVWLESYKMGLDVVPALHVLPSGGGPDHYCIPKGHGSSSWIATNPKLDAILVTELDEQHHGMFRPVVRLLKWWNRVQNQERIRPYHLEVLCMYVFAGEPGVHCPTALARFFDAAQSFLAATCPDPTGLGRPVDSGLQPAARLLTAKALRRSAATARQALQLSLEGNERAAVIRWRAIFGAKFPGPTAPTLGRRCCR
jgi:hypothetical protein